jgi:hypothetical protein
VMVKGGVLAPGWSSFQGERPQKPGSTGVVRLPPKIASVGDLPAWKARPSE